MNLQKLKLCYVLPEFKKSDATHFSHIYDFLKEITKSFDLFLITEKGEKPPASLGYTHFYRTRINFPPLRFFETLLIFIFARFFGYRDFYVHYSFSSAFASSVVSRLSRGRAFYWNCGEPWKYRRNLFREWFEQMVYRIITFQVTGTRSLANKYASYYRISRKKIKIMPNWIDLSRFRATESKKEIFARLRIPKDKKVILFVHHLSQRKGSHMIIPVARELVKISSDVVFIIIGDGPDKKRIINEINNDQAIGRHVQIKGSIPNTEIPNYLTISDVFFMPSEEEGFPRVILESMALGVPFVASNVGGIKDFTPLITHKYIINGENALGFAHILNEIINQPTNTKTHFSNELKKWVKEYDVHHMARKFTDLFI